MPTGTATVGQTLGKLEARKPTHHHNSSNTTSKNNNANTFEQCTPTEENFLRLSLQNPQCEFLTNGERGMRRVQRKLQRSVSRETCLHEVYNTLLDTMDYVGTTEQLNNTTLPILSKMLQLPKSFHFKTYRVTNHSNTNTTTTTNNTVGSTTTTTTTTMNNNNNTNNQTSNNSTTHKQNQNQNYHHHSRLLQLHDVSSTGIDMIHQMSYLDQVLYNRILSDYKIEDVIWETNMILDYY